MLMQKRKFLRSSAAGRRQGFTLVEMLLVLVILATLAAIVLPQLAGKGEKAKVNAAKAQLSTFDTALDMFETDMGYYPRTSDGLDLLNVIPTNPPKDWNGPYLKTAVPNDPWNAPYIYECPGRHNTRTYDVLSMGPDGMRDTADDIANYPIAGN